MVTRGLCLEYHYCRLFLLAGAPWSLSRMPGLLTVSRVRVLSILSYRWLSRHRWKRLPRLLIGASA